MKKLDFLGFKSLTERLPYLLITKWAREDGEPDPLPGKDRVDYPAWLTKTAGWLMGGLHGLAFMTFLTSGQPAKAFAAMIFIYFAIVLSVIDLGYLILPFALTIPLTLLGLASSSLGLFASLPDALQGTFVGVASTLILYLFRAIGSGDILAMAALGAWFGVSGVVAGWFIALAIFLIYALPCRFKGYKHVAFGPAIMGAGVSLLFWQASIVRQDVVVVYVDFIKQMLPQFM